METRWTGAMVTVLICRQGRGRVGMVVREVFQVAVGTEVPDDEMGERMAWWRGG